MDTLNPKKSKSITFTVRGGFFTFLANLAHSVASNPEMEYQVILFIFQKNSAMATLGLKLNRDSQLGRTFSLPSQKNFPISFKLKVAIARFAWKMQKKVWYYEKWVGRHASFPPRGSVKGHF
jgi:hypothetical protein